MIKSTFGIYRNSFTYYIFNISSLMTVYVYYHNINGHVLNITAR